MATVREEAVQKDETATSVEKANTILNPLRGIQELIKVIPHLRQNA